MTKQKKIDLLGKIDSSNTLFKIPEGIEFDFIATVNVNGIPVEFEYEDKVVKLEWRPVIGSTISAQAVTLARRRNENI